MLRIAIQAKGRLNEQSSQLLIDADIEVKNPKRKLLVCAENFPAEILYLRDD
ncbi:MAG: ATP phosphoribosyltransferase, partial [Bacteroidales bacterium]